MAGPPAEPCERYDVKRLAGYISVQELASDGGAGVVLVRSQTLRRHVVERPTRAVATRDALELVRRDRGGRR